MSETQHLEGKVVRWRLPCFESPTQEGAPVLKRLRLGQGELAQVHDGGEPVQYLAAIELLAGAVRGNHYHLAKRETVYLITGEIEVVLEDLENRGRETVSLAAGDLIFIPPRIAHALRTVVPGWALEFAPAPLDPKDTFRHPLT